MVKICEEDSPRLKEVMTTTTTTREELKGGSKLNDSIKHQQQADISRHEKPHQTANGEKKTLLPEANLQLVEKVRELLKHEFKENEAIYSRVHYEDIMDPGSPNTCWRYLLQRDESVEQALALIKSTLAWRQENRIDTLRADALIKDFWLRAPIGFLGKTKDGDEFIYAIGKNFKKPDAAVKQTIRDFIAFLLFDWDRRHKHDLEQLVVVFDTSDTGFRNIDLDFSAWLVSIRDYAPARIKAVYFVGIPYIMRPIIRLIISWLPERFKRIAHCGSYDQLVRANIDDDCIPEEIGGKADNKWRLAPLESPWAHEVESPEANDVFEKICQACSFNTSQEYLDKVYKMQKDYEKSIRSAK